MNPSQAFKLLIRNCGGVPHSQHLWRLEAKSAHNLPWPRAMWEASLWSCPGALQEISWENLFGVLQDHTTSAKCQMSCHGVKEYFKEMFSLV